MAIETVYVLLYMIHGLNLQFENVRLILAEVKQYLISPILNKSVSCVNVSFAAALSAS